MSLFNGLTLAYIGDAYYELLVRNYFLNQGITKVTDLHKQAMKFTSGKNQSRIISYLLEKNILTEEEINIFKRGRNSKQNQYRKNLDKSTHHQSTGFEALFGFYFVEKRVNRAEEIFCIILNFDAEGCVSNG